jgi:hypothetical protein
MHVEMMPSWVGEGPAGAVETGAEDDSRTVGVPGTPTQ